MPLPVTNCSQPLVLATASDWVVPGSVMSSAIYDCKQELSSKVELLQPESVGSMVRGSVKEDPIHICSDSDDEFLKCDEESEFDADALFNDTLDVFEPI